MDPSVQAEIAALKRRYLVDAFDGTTMRIRVQPTGRLPVALSYLPVEVVLRGDYPSQVIVPNVLGNEDLPPSIVKSINMVLQRYCTSGQWAGKPMLRHALRYIENHLDVILNELILLQSEAAAGKPVDHAGGASTVAGTIEGNAPAVAQGPGSQASSVAPATHVGDKETPPSIVGQPPIQPAPASAAGSGVDALFDAAGDWSVDEHVRFELAVQEYLHVKGRRVTDPDVWAGVSRAVGSSRSPAQCLARFMVLQRLVANWHAVCVAPFRAAQPEIAALHALPTGSHSGGSEADPEGEGEGNGASWEDREGRERAGRSGHEYLEKRASRRKQHAKQPTGPHSSSMQKVPFPERRVVAGHSGTAGEDGGEESEDDEDDGDRKNPMHVRLYKFFKPGARGGEEAAEEGEGEEEEEDGEDQDDEEENSEDGEDGEEQEENDDNEGDEGAATDDDEGSEVDDSHVAAFTGLHLDPRHAGTLLALDKPSMFGIGTAAVTRLHVTLQCTRCAIVVTANMAGAGLQRQTSAADNQEQQADGSAGAPVPSPAAGAGAAGPASSSSAGGPKPVSAALTQGTEWRCWCPKCSLLLSSTFRPTLVHEGSACMGYVDTTQAQVAGMAGVWLAATCVECGAPAESPRLAPPCTWETSCRHCYARMRLEARGTVLQAATADNAQAIPAGLDAARHKHKDKQKFTPGKPLPEEGTCKHYGQSYRWLRFPCCDLAFPCDTCHDDASDHPYEWAKRMICGHCAREQPFSNAPCVACGGSMRKSTRHSKFWEGGAGQRNRALLSSKDEKKWKSSRLKTKSKKHERVGKAGAGGKGKPAGKTFERYRAGVGVEVVTVKPKAPKR